MPRAQFAKVVFLVLAGVVVGLTAIQLIGTSANNTFSRVGSAVHGEGQARPAAAAAGPAEPVARKIIYTGAIDLVVENVEQADQELRQLVGRHAGAYLAQAEVHGASGAPRSGNWTVRVPVEQFETFRLGVRRLGEVARDGVDSQDVTDQYFDLEARIQNNQARLDSLRKLLDKAALGKIDDYLAVQQRLDQVTAELDVQKGQLQRLEKLSTLATVRVTMHERRGYVAASFGTRIVRAFGGSLDALLSFGQGIVILLVAVGPWLAVVLVVAAPCWWFFRRARVPAPAGGVAEGMRN